MKKVIIFGVGNLAEKYINPDLISTVEYCVDNSVEKQGKEFYKKKIYSPEILTKENKNNIFIIIFSQNYYSDILEQLEGYGFIEGQNFVSADNWRGSNEVPSAYHQLEWEENVVQNGGFENLFEKRKVRWSQRVQKMCSIISPESASVMDIGCGNMNLKNYLSDNIKYYGVDYTSRGADTIICNFNKHEFPSQTADTFFISGCLEYIEDVNWFFMQLSKAKKEIIMSYNPIGIVPNIYERMSYSWKNNLSTDEIICGLEKLGFRLAYKDVNEKERYIIIKFEKCDTAKPAK